MGKRRRGARSAFAIANVREHIALHHPRCPPALVDRYAAEICSRVWSPPVTLGHAFGLVATNDVRHRMTDYERLLAVRGLTREEARLIVSAEVRQILSAWDQN